MREITQVASDLQPLGPPVGVASGQVLAGRYVLETLMGEGAHGQVFRAHDRLTSTEVALKVLRPQAGGPWASIEQLGVEVRCARQVQHPNVCRAYEVVRAGDQTFVVMELAAGGSLAAELAARRTAPWAQRVRDARGIAAGLAAFHQRGLVHRDVKPANVLRMADGRLVLSDFGLTERHERIRSWSGGTPAFMAPELSEGACASLRSDVWSLGLVLQAVLFEGNGDEASSPAARAARALCCACLATPPELRPTDATQVAERLEELDGLSLAERLAHGPLAVSDVLLLGHRLLDELALLHRRGQVHGHIHPGNVFLAGGVAAGARLLCPTADEWLYDPTRVPAFCAPEEAVHEHERDGRADIFSVGKLLHGCLPLAQGAELPALVRRMTDLDRARRPRDAASLAADLLSLYRAAGSRSVQPAPEIEQRVLSLLVIQAPRQELDSELGAWSGRWWSVAPGPGLHGPDRVIMAADPSASLRDQTDTLARWSLRFTRQSPDRRLALTTGRAVLSELGPTGEAVARAFEGLATMNGPGLFVDDTSATLLAGSFEHQAPAGRLRMRSAVDRPRTVLGRSTPCLGRERELATLLALWDECVTEQVARVVLVSAPAGAGKSRLRQETLSRLQARGDRFNYLLARGDSLHQGAPFALLGPALRDLIGLADDSPAPAQQARLSAHVARLVPAHDVARVAAFMGEMIGLHFDDGKLPALAAARRDARLMADQILTSWLEWVAGLCADKPLLIVLEDLHWGDVPSVQLIDAALRTCASRAMLVLALARPDVDERLPALFARRALQRIALPPLGEKTSRALLRHMLDDLEAKVADEVIRRADGNPFFLEELARAVRTGGNVRAGEPLPASVLGTVQARFAGLTAEEKCTLRAASLFGETFVATGVLAVAQGELAAVERALHALEQQEVIYSRFRHDRRELAFRHALLRDAAYDLLDEPARKRGHHRVAVWLEREQEHDAHLLVEHHERAGNLPRAAHFSRIAAEQALDANDLVGAVGRVERGVRCGAQGHLLGHLRLTEARACYWLGQYADGERASRDAIALLDGEGWFLAVAELIGCAGQLGRREEVERWTELAQARAHGPESQCAYLWCLAWAAGFLAPLGALALARSLLERVTAVPLDEPDKRIVGRVFFVRLHIANLEVRLQDAHEMAVQALSVARALGDTREVATTLVCFGAVLESLGDLEQALEAHSTALALSSTLDLRIVKAGAVLNIGCVSVLLGRFAEARPAFMEALVHSEASDDPRMSGMVRVMLARVELLDGAAERASREAEMAVERLRTLSTCLPLAFAALARSRLAEGRIEEALDAADQAARAAETAEGIEDNSVLIPLVLAECRLASADVPGARVAIEWAVSDLENRTAAITRPEWKTSVLTRIPDHVRTLELARQLGVRP